MVESTSMPVERTPRIAVIGGGIFGTTCAIELGSFADVRLFERRDDLLAEASFANQWRHHSGFHYPRSPDTVAEIKEAKDEFSELYAAAIVDDFDAFYCTSSSGLEITREMYLDVCRNNELSFEEALPPANVVAHERISLSLKTDEAAVNCDILREIAARELRRNPRIECFLGTEVCGAELLEDGRKRLHSQGKTGEATADFDYVINATYANHNEIAHWLGFPIRPLRFDLLELLVLEIPIPKIAVTVLDGPFSSLISTGEENLFMLSHIHESVLGSLVTQDGLPPEWGTIESNREAMLRRCRPYLPILDCARVVESRYATRTVKADEDDFDGRPTVMTSHGLGCWSLLGGKIITCVTNAREIASAIQLQERRPESREDPGLTSMTAS